MIFVYNTLIERGMKNDPAYSIKRRERKPSVVTSQMWQLIRKTTS